MGADPDAPSSKAERACRSHNGGTTDAWLSDVSSVFVPIFVICLRLHNSIVKFQKLIMYRTAILTIFTILTILTWGVNIPKTAETAILTR